ncbi:MAG: dienelactone hydrolase family protein [Actinobacteria bacterium]|nr:dienelactone hydrolase family protein [Actinomycetota bacterium]
MPAALAVPSHAQPRGAVVVIQEAFGITSHIESICTRLASAGWLAVAPALYHREGSPVFAYDDFAGVLPVMQTLSAAGIDADLDGTFQFLADSGFAPKQCATVGFCMGGTVSLYAGTRMALGASVTFYGGGVAAGRFGFPPLIELAPTLRTPWLGLYGDLDKGIPFADVDLLREAAATAAVPTEVVRSADADHGFNCDDRAAVFNAAAAADGWQRTLAWFDRFITSESPR